MISRYMSTTYSMPSGPVSRLTGRNHCSVDVRNSVVSSACGRRARYDHALRLEQAAMDHVLGVVHAEVIALELGRKRVGLVDRLAAGRREEAVGRGFRHAVELDPRRVLAARQPPRIRLAGRIDPRRMPVAADVQHQVRRGVERIARQIVMRDRGDVQGVLLVGHQEAVAPIVHRLAKAAGPAAGRFQRAAIGLEAKAGGADLHVRAPDAGRGSCRRCSCRWPHRSSCRRPTADC